MKETFSKYCAECFQITYDDIPSSIFYVYDQNARRQTKLNKILGLNENIKIDPECKLIFEQDNRLKILFIHHDNVFENNYTNYSYGDLLDIFNDWLREDKRDIKTEGFRILISNARFYEIEYNKEKYKFTKGLF